tara:strand:- start:3340 stop:3717 length:378 start_codon:yes stop_codon:yes gene_type:complete
MAAVGVTGAVFTVSVGAVQYEDQITSGTINTTPTIVRTKTLSDVAFDQVDLNSTMSIDFLYDEASGMYAALQTAIAAGTSVAVIVASTAGTWTGSAMMIESADLTYPADNVATVSTSLTGTVTFA